MDRELGDQNGAAYDLGNMANVLMAEGEFPAAQRLLEESVKISRRTGEKRALAFALYNLASVSTSLGDLDKAEQVYSESRQVFADAGNKLGETGAISALGDVRLKKGDLTGARKLNEDAIAEREAIGSSAWTAENQMAIAEISLEEGRALEAETALRHVIKDFRAHDDMTSAAEAEALLINSFLAQDKRADAKNAALEAAQLAAKSGGSRGCNLCNTCPSAGAYSFRGDIRSSQFSADGSYQRQEVGNCRRPIRGTSCLGRDGNEIPKSS